MTTNGKSWRRIATAGAALAILLLTLLIVSFPADFDRLYLRWAGGIIGGINSRIRIWIVGSVVVCLIGWASVAAACFAQRGKEQPSPEPKHLRD
jgi:hypothetical protein